MSKHSNIEKKSNLNDEPNYKGPVIVSKSDEPNNNGIDWESNQVNNEQMLNNKLTIINGNNNDNKCNTDHQLLINSDDDDVILIQKDNDILASHPIEIIEPPSYLSYIWSKKWF